MPLFTAYTKVDLEPENVEASSSPPFYRAVLPKIFRKGKGVKSVSRVGIRWFKVGGPGKVRNEYRQLIRDYEELPRDRQAVMEEVVDETFSYDECEALWRFLYAREDWSGSFTIYKSYTPAWYVDDPEVGRVTRSFQSSMFHLIPGYAVVSLAEAPGYDLFQVGGYYLAAGLPSGYTLPWLRNRVEEGVPEVLPMKKEVTASATSCIATSRVEYRGDFVIIEWFKGTPLSSDKASNEGSTVGERLTVDECQALCRFLNCRGQFSNTFTATRRASNDRALMEQPGSGDLVTLNLSAMPVYDLPFRVYGRYSLVAAKGELTLEWKWKADFTNGRQPVSEQQVQ